MHDYVRANHDLSRMTSKKMNLKLINDQLQNHDPQS